MGKKYRYKGIWIAAAVIVLLCGCGNEKAGTKGDVETLQEEEGIPSGEDVEIRENLPGQENVSSGNNMMDQEKSAAQEEPSASAGGEALEAEEEEADGISIVWDDTTGEGTKTIYGNVKELGTGSFSIQQAMTGMLENGQGDIMVMAADGNEEEETLVTITYDDAAKFTVSTTTDGGITSTKREGSSKDVGMDSSLGITGSWEGEIFRADEITIFISQ